MIAHMKIQSERKPVVVLLHGLGGDLAVWEVVQAELRAAGIGSVAMDLRGMGMAKRSQDYEAYSVEEVAIDMRKRLDRLGVKKPILVGHCYGGMVAQQLVADGYKVSGLVLVASASRLPWWGRVWGVKGLGKWLTKGLGGMLSSKHRSYRPDYAKYRVTGEYSPWRIAQDMMHTGLRSYFYLLSHLFDFDVRDSLDEIKVSVLVVAGERDYVLPMGLSKEMVENLGRAEIKVIEGVGHMIPLHMPVVLAGMVMGFVRRWGGGV